MRALLIALALAGVAAVQTTVWGGDHLEIIAPTGRVRPGQLPATHVARTVFRGGYEGLPAAWSELESWIAVNGLTSAPDLWEIYTVGPEASRNPDDWCTELNRPLLG